MSAVCSRHAVLNISYQPVWKGKFVLFWLYSKVLLSQLEANRRVFWYYFKELIHMLVIFYWVPWVRLVPRPDPKSWPLNFFSTGVVNSLRKGRRDVCIGIVQVDVKCELISYHSQLWWAQYKPLSCDASLANLRLNPALPSARLPSTTSRFSSLPVRRHFASFQLGRAPFVCIHDVACFLILSDR